MDTDLLIIFGSLAITAISLGGMGLGAMRIWTRRRPPLDSAALTEQIHDQVSDVVREEVARAMEERDREIDELHERLDFTERLLSQRQLDAGPPPTAGRKAPPPSNP